jgi:hypothetical protein
LLTTLPFWIQIWPRLLRFQTICTESLVRMRLPSKAIIQRPITFQIQMLHKYLTSGNDWMKFTKIKTRPEKVSATILCSFVRSFNHLLAKMLKAGHVMLGNIWPGSNQIFGVLHKRRVQKIERTPAEFPCQPHWNITNGQCPTQSRLFLKENVIGIRRLVLFEENIV